MSLARHCSSLLIVGLLLMGCLTLGPTDTSGTEGDGQSSSGDGDGDGDGECNPPNGTYDFRYEFKSGNCSQIFPNALDTVIQTSYDRITFVNGKSASQTLCSRESVMATRACVVEVDRTCSLPSPAIGTYMVTGELDVLENGRLEGTLSFSINNLGRACQDVFYARGAPTF